MKKIVLAALLTVGSVFAQDITFGTSVNVGMSQPTGDVEFDAGLAYGAGVKAKINLGTINLQPEVLFAQRMSSMEFMGTSIDASVSFIMVPLLVSYPINEQISILAGPSVNSAIFGKQTVGDTESDIDDLNAFGFSAIGGVEYAINEQISAGVRYDYMLTNLVTTDGAGDNGLGAVVANVGYNF